MRRGLVRVLLMPHMQGEQALGEIRGWKASTPESFERAMQAIGDAMCRSKISRCSAPDAALIVDEFECAANLLHHACGWACWH